MIEFLGMMLAKMLHEGMLIDYPLASFFIARYILFNLKVSFGSIIELILLCDQGPNLTNLLSDFPHYPRIPIFKQVHIYPMFIKPIICTMLNKRRTYLFFFRLGAGVCNKIIYICSKGFEKVISAKVNLKGSSSTNIFLQFYLGEKHGGNFFGRFLVRNCFQGKSIGTSCTLRNPCPAKLTAWNAESR